ncbi:hypothetical protein OG786_11335 [Streptomyces sp. NBC_00101]|uniref:hypothetical protein n=1 Tax=Streptomyces sp. NBC_00101 TaxID=2975651 RepID=UPI0032449196
MSGKSGEPAVGALVVDASRPSVIGEFRGASGPYWQLRPVTGGAEWQADPEHVRVANPAERLRAENARCNARSRGERL